MHEFTISTDTASLAFFDVESLKHRLSDTADWWDLEEDLIEEINEGKLGFCALRSDGYYKVSVAFTSATEADAEFNLASPSGRLFIGPGEEITGAGYDPDNSKNNCGKIINIEEDKIAVSVKRIDNNIHFYIVPSGSSTNAFESEVEVSE